MWSLTFPIERIECLHPLRLRVLLGDGARELEVAVKRVVLQEAYRPHVRAELEALAEEGVLLREVLDALDPGAAYGIVWYGKEQHRKNTPSSARASSSARTCGR